MDKLTREDLVDLKALRPVDQDHSMNWWLEMDREVNRVFRLYAPLVTWLMGHGLRFPPDDDGPNLIKASACHLVPAEAPHVGYVLNSLPLHITHSEVAHEVLEHSILIGVGASAKRCAEAVEGMLLGLRKFDGIKGLTDLNPAPMTDIARAKGALCDRKFYGPYLLVFKDAKDCTWIDDVSVIDGVGTPYLHDRECFLVQATSDVVRMVCAIPPTLIVKDGVWRVVCIMVPQVRCPLNGDSGIAWRRPDDSA